MSDHSESIANKPILNPRNSEVAKTLTESQYVIAVGVANVINYHIQKTGSFRDALTDYAHAFARSEKFDAMKGEIIIRDVYKEQYGRTMNAAREALLENAKNLPETAREQAHRASERDRGIQEHVIAPLLDQPAGDGRGIAILAGDVQHAIPQQRLAFGRRHRIPHQAFGKIRRRCDPHQRHDAFGTGDGRKQRDPAAHGGAHENQRAGGQMIDRRQRIGRPLPDGAIAKRTVAGAMPGIVEPQHSLASRGGEGGEAGRLVPGHVAAKAGQENDGGAASVQPVPRQRRAVAPVHPSRRHEFWSLFAA